MGDIFGKMIDIVMMLVRYGCVKMMNMCAKFQSFVTIGFENTVLHCLVTNESQCLYTSVI